MSVSETTGKIQGVEGPNKNGFYTVKDNSDLEYTTKIGDIADDARQLIGQLATIEFKLVQKDQWTNRYLESVKAAADPVAVSQASNGAGDPGRDRRITLLAALKVAAITVNSCAEGTNAPAKQRMDAIKLYAESLASWALTWGDTPTPPAFGATPAAPTVDQDIPF